jgi:hypothetical protein
MAIIGGIRHFQTYPYNGYYKMAIFNGKINYFDWAMASIAMNTGWW